MNLLLPSLPEPMYIEQIYTKHLSASAYYIESGKEAAVIDPMRDMQQYIDLADQRGATIKFVFGTHFQSDYVSGCLELARKTGAVLVFGPDSEAEFPFHKGGDGEEFRIGFLTIRVLHTPGHTRESVCYLLLDDRNNPHSVFTGDTLFVDDVGRPDLWPAVKNEAAQRAGKLYESIHTKLSSLPNYVIVYPGHGAGSSCGKVIGAQKHSTIGMQRKSNYVFTTPDKNAFIRLVTDSPEEPPVYFARIAKLNRTVCENSETVMQRNLIPLDLEKFKAASVLSGTTIIDTRRKEAFSAVHIPGSVFLGMEGNFEFVAALVLKPDTELLVVCEPGSEKDVFKCLSRTGFDHVQGYLNGGINTWLHAGEAVERMENIPADDVASGFHYPTDIIVDVRNPYEWIPGIVAGARLISLPRIGKHNTGLDLNKKIFVYCSCGYRSLIAASLLKKEGYKKVINVTGGMSRMKQTPIPVRQLSRIG